MDIVNGRLGDVTMKTALCTIAFQDRKFEDVLNLAVRAGFDGVEPWGKPDHMPGSYNAAENRRMARAIRERGLDVSQYGSYINPVSPGFEREMAEGLDTASDLGTDKIRVWAGSCGSSEATDEDWQKVISGFRRFADCAGDRGVSLVLEMHLGYLCDTVRGSLRLVEGVDRPNFLLNFQPMYTDSASRVVEVARQVASRVATVHAQNYTTPGRNARSLISAGYVDYRAVVRELAAAGFDGYLEVEFVKEDDPDAALMADAAFLRGLCERTG